jgi:hypothetical protein
MQLHRLVRHAAFAVTLFAGFAVPFSRVTARVIVPSVTLSAPPAYPDIIHVLNGCHLSTIRFLSRYLAEFPAERGETVVVNMRNANGSIQAHTIALISWQGEVWGRDEYYGVFPLGCPSAPPTHLERLSGRAERMLEEHAQTMVRTGQASARGEPPTHLSPDQTLQDVTAATRLIPFTSSVFWVRCGSRERPMAFFRPGDKRIAVYDPEHGTSTAECACPDDAKVVLLVAARLGYAATSVRTDRTSSQPILMAAADAPAGEVLR